MRRREFIALLGGATALSFAASAQGPTPAGTPVSAAEVCSRPPAGPYGVVHQARSTPQHVVERRDGKTGGRGTLRARAGSRCGRRGHPVLQEPVLGAADGERRNCPGVLGVLSEVPQASMSRFGVMQVCLALVEAES